MTTELTRCAWPSSDELYIRYHDEEWGVPKGDDRALFEKIVLEGFQSGLSWITILRKRDHFRDVFDGFEPERIARYGDRKVAALMADPGIVRNRLKIEATIDNAKAYLAMSETESFAGLLWDLAGGKPQQNALGLTDRAPAETEASKAISKALKSRGFRFVGPTTVYAFMQSVGMVNDHSVTCHRHSACRKLAKSFNAPTARRP
jgi:DNA-3-methyladenine glycosylase I